MGELVTDLALQAFAFALGGSTLAILAVPLAKWCIKKCERFWVRLFQALVGLDESMGRLGAQIDRHGEKLEHHSELLRRTIERE